MKYCSRCGKELADDAVFCYDCGCACDPNMNVPMGGNQPEEDKVSVGFCVLAFFIPLFGLIYWAVKRADTPKNANAVGLTALISWGVNMISSIITSIVFAGTMAEFFEMLLMNL
jgi:hypothetical protein